MIIIINIIIIFIIIIDSSIIIIIITCIISSSRIIINIIIMVVIVIILIIISTIVFIVAIYEFVWKKGIFRPMVESIFDLISSFYRHQIKSRYPYSYKVRSWNNGVHYVFYYTPTAPMSSFGWIGPSIFLRVP